jgi:predicted MFS family arabinose efflux permease
MAGAAFVYVTAEGLPVGLLGPMSSGLHVPASSIGLLVTVYAAVAGLAAVPVTALVDRCGRRQVTVAAVALLAASQIAIAAAPDYALVLSARVVCALAHGVFWSILAPVAARLVPAGRAGRATATVFLGNSLALVVGIPVATALGQLLGWRGSMLALGVAAAASALALRATMPALPPAARRQDLRSVPALLRHRSLLAVCVVTALLVTGHFTAYTYITSLVHRDAGLTGIAISAVLLLYGLAGVIGVAVVGRVIDNRLRLAACTCAVWLTAALALLAQVAHGSLAGTLAAIVLWGAAFTALPVALQSAVLRVAPDRADLASALYVVAFQIGIGGGALVGSVMVAGGHLPSVPAVALTLVVAGTIVLTSARRAFPSHAAARRATEPTTAEPTTAEPTTAEPTTAELSPR